MEQKRLSELVTRVREAANRPTRPAAAAAATAPAPIAPPPLPQATSASVNAAVDRFDEGTSSSRSQPSRMSIMPHVVAGRHPVSEIPAGPAGVPAVATTDYSDGDEAPRQQPALQSRVVIPPPGASLAARQVPTAVAPRRTGFDRDGFEARRPRVQSQQQASAELEDAGTDELDDDHKIDDRGGAARGVPPAAAVQRKIAVMPSARAALAKRQSSEPASEPSPPVASAQVPPRHQPSAPGAPAVAKQRLPKGPSGVQSPLGRPPTAAAATGVEDDDEDILDDYDDDDRGIEESSSGWQPPAGGYGGGGSAHAAAPPPAMQQQVPGWAGALARAPSAASLSWGLGSGVFDSGGSRIKVRVCLDLSRNPCSLTRGLQLHTHSWYCCVSPQVVVRKRPMNKREIRSNELDTVQTVSRRTVLVHEPRQKVDLTKYTETVREPESG